MNAVQIGGKTLYLKPWMEGSKFRKKIYREGAMLDQISGCATLLLVQKGAYCKFKPLKFARVQIKLSYPAPRPSSVYVPVKNCDGERENQKVEIEYSQLPYSCSLCKDDNQIVSEAQMAIQKEGMAERMDNDDALNEYNSGPIAQINPEANIDSDFEVVTDIAKLKEALIVTNAFQSREAIDEEVPQQTY